MSRSYKKNPAGGIASSCGQKHFKQSEHRAERKKVNQLLKKGKELLPHPKEYGNEWASPRDGKQWWNKPLGTRIKEWLAWLRK